MYSKILLGGLKKGNRDQPCAINTVFGWVLMGHIDDFFNTRFLTASR